MAGVWAAVRGSETERARLLAMSAEMGARHADAERSLAALIGEIDDVERLIFAKFVEAGEGMPSEQAPRALAGVSDIHDCCARMRTAAIAGSLPSCRPPSRLMTT